MKRHLLVAIVASALVARLIAAIFFGDTFHFVDEAIYADTARGLAEGAGFSAEYRSVPGFAILLSVLPGVASASVIRPGWGLRRCTV